MPEPTPLIAKAASIRDSNVAVVTVNYRTPGLTKRCIAALSKERDALPRLRAVVVDGGSGDGSAAELAEAFGRPAYADWVEFVPLAINGGFGWANNQAMLTLARQPQPPDFIHVLNPDTEVMPGGIEALVAEIRAHPGCGAVGSQLVAPGGAIVPSAFRFPSAGREFVASARSEAVGRLLGIAPTVADAVQSAEVDWVSGASVMFRSDALREVGLFDDGFFLYFEEVELMHRLKAKGWGVRQVPESRVVHIEGASTGGPAARAQPRTWYESRRRYFALTGGVRALASANAGRFAGRALGLAKGVIGRPPGDGTRTKDLFRSGLWPRARDGRRSVASWGDPPGTPPAWMTQP